VPPEVNVLATALLVLVLLLMTLNLLVQRRLARRDALRTAADPHAARLPA
jgi:spermidine/putrescine transport system permease protein